MAGNPRLASLPLVGNRPGITSFERAVPAPPNNSQGIALPSVKSRGSRFITNSINPGATLSFPCSGTQFYVSYATAPIMLQPSGGDFELYESGTGLQLDLINAFDQINIKNTTAQPIVFQIFVGFDGFIDNRLFLINGQQTLVAKPTYPTPSSAPTVAIADISGQAFVDINGVEWYALSRDHFIVSNTDTGAVILVQQAGSVVANGPAVAAIQPATSIRLDYAGNFSLCVGGGNVNAIVSEAYVSIPKL